MSFDEFDTKDVEGYVTSRSRKSSFNVDTCHQQQQQQQQHDGYNKEDPHFVFIPIALECYPKKTTTVSSASSASSSFSLPLQLQDLHVIQDLEDSRPSTSSSSTLNNNKSKNYNSISASRGITLLQAKFRGRKIYKYFQTMMANTKYVDNEIEELLMQDNNQEIFNFDDLDIDLIDHDDNNYESHYKEKNHNNNSNINRSRIITSSSQFSFGNNQNKTTTINQDNSYSAPSHHNDINSNNNNNHNIINDYETSSEISVISSNNQFSNHTPEDNKIFKRHYEHNQRLFSLNITHIHNILNHNNNNNNNNNNNRKVTKDRGNAAVSIALKKKTNTLVSGTFGGKPKMSRVKRPGQTRGKLPAWMKHEEEDHEDKEEEKG
jgi:hypothetical protein